MKQKPFKVVFKSGWLKKDFLVESPDGVKAKVLTDPERKWYKILLQVITLELYQAPYEYLIEIDKSEYDYDPYLDKL